MLVPEVAEALIVARGCNEEEPVEPGSPARWCAPPWKSSARWATLGSRSGATATAIVVALTQDLAGYAFRLGDAADKLASEDPLVPPQRTLQQLREVFAPDRWNTAFSDSRLIRLAAAASVRSALSSRQELYPKGHGGRPRSQAVSRCALRCRFAHGSRKSASASEAGIPKRPRFPTRPRSISLLEEAGFEFEWNSDVQGSRRLREPTPRSHAISSVAHRLAPVDDAAAER